MYKKGTFVALAWPQTKVVKEGKWYDTPMKWLGFAKDGYYQVGHAALLLIENETGKVNYFDFGRYHTPLKKGRVRDKETDPDLIIETEALFDENGNVLNADAILKEVAHNDSNHGDGEMWASLHTNINLNKVVKYAKKQQSKGYISYGPLAWGGTNCSRFVGRVAYKSAKSPGIKFLLRYPYTFSQSPKSVVRIIGWGSKQSFRIEKELPVHNGHHDTDKLKGTLKPTNLPKNVPAEAKWLAGQGVGGWFYLKESTVVNKFRIRRFSPDGILECDRLFDLINTSDFDVKKDFEFTHVSHCMECRVLQEGKGFIFKHQISK